MSTMIGIHISTKLAENNKIREDVGDRIYPLVAPMGVPTYPFICYQTSVTNVEYTKDGASSDTVNAAVAIIAKTYAEAAILAQSARWALECEKGSYESFEVDDCMLLGTQEDYLDELDAYSVTLNFEINVES